MVLQTLEDSNHKKGHEKLMNVLYSVPCSQGYLSR